MNVQNHDTTKAETVGAELVPLATLVPAEVFAPGGVEAILAKIEQSARATVTDISTVAGRKALASVAHKIARSKTALDDMGKTLVAEWKQRAGVVDAERRTVRERLDALKDEVRKPLTDWEDAEKARVEAHEAALAAIPESSMYGARETAAEVKARLDYLLDYPDRDWQEFDARAEAVLASEISRTREILATVERREAERAELDRLRAEQVAREQRDRDERIAREAAERARQEAEAKAAAEREAAERAARAEQERVERERQAAEQAAREAEERAARAEAERIAAAEKAEGDRIAAMLKAEREKDAAIYAERERVAQEKAAADAETARREADKKHRGKINAAACDALVEVGLDPALAELVVTAIARGEIPNVKISY